MLRFAPLLLLSLSCAPDQDTDTLDTDIQDTGVDDTDTDTDVDPPSPPAARVVVYQLVVRQFSNLQTDRVVDGTLEQNGVGRFEDIDEAALDGLVELGVTHVWLTGVLRQATLTDWSSIGLPPDDPDVVKGRAGSFYAIRDYYDTSPDYAVEPERRLDELVSLIDRIHDAGLQVLIDLVPNHVARGYASVVHPERDFGLGDDATVFFAPQNRFFYLPDPPGQRLELTRPEAWNPSGVTFDGLYAPEDGTTVARTPRATGNNVTSPRPGPNDWYETVKLNWGYNFAVGEAHYDPRPPVWDDFDRILAYWQALGVDGFRADFAHFVPNEAWRWLIDQARSRDPQVLFLAEAYEDLPGLQDAGFDAVYYDAAYDALKGLYQGSVRLEDVDSVLLALSDEDRRQWVLYLENHDERRIASPITSSASPDDSGFGSAAAGRQLAPLQYLFTPGPVLFYNGQEVGETGAGIEGFSGENGRSSIYDYGSLPALQGWVNGHAYDGGSLTQEQRDLRAWYSALLTGPVRDPAVRGSGFWGLRYINNSQEHSDFPDELYTFARFQPGGARLVVVVANFRPGAQVTGPVRLPGDLLDAAGLSGDTFQVTRLFDERGAVEELVEHTSRFGLTTAGISATLSDQSAAVFEVVPR